MKNKLRQIKDSFDNNTQIVFWVLPLVTWLLMVCYAGKTNNQLRYEELAESIRNVYWLRHGLIYDYLSHNVGLYWSLSVFYSAFGFSLNIAKWFYLSLALISNYAMAALVRHVTNYRVGMVPLLAMLLSPTRIYFTPIQALYGIDLLYLPILLFLLTEIIQQRRYWGHVSNIVFWFLMVISLFSYSVFMFYVPLLVLLYIAFLVTKMIKGGYLISGVIGMGLGLWPLMPVINKYKLFGYYLHMGKSLQTVEYSPTFVNFFQNLRLMISDLVWRGDSYNFELVGVEFSHGLTILALFSVGIIIARMLESKKSKVWIWLALLLIAFNVIVIHYYNAPSSNPGMRRSTPILVAFYVLFAISWINVAKLKWKNKLSSRLLLGGLLLLPMHHILVLPLNFQTAGRISKFSYSHWFSDRANMSPREIIDRHVMNVQDDDVLLRCDSFEGQSTKRCRYPEVYSAIALQCEVIDLNCHRVAGYDPMSDQYVEIEPKIWEVNYWPH